MRITLKQLARSAVVALGLASCAGALAQTAICYNCPPEWADWGTQLRAIKANPLWAGGEFGASRRCAASECSPVAPTCKVRQARTRPPVAGAHRAGILAKRLRYGIEALRPLLGKRRAHHGYEEAVERQGCIGTRRDLQQALALLDRLDADPGLREVVRGGAADVGLSR